MGTLSLTFQSDIQNAHSVLNIGIDILLPLYSYCALGVYNVFTILHRIIATRIYKLLSTGCLKTNLINNNFQIFSSE